MKPKKYSILLLILCITALSTAQLRAQTSTETGEISGKVLDESQKAFPYATVSLLNAKDSTAVKGTLSQDNGNYLFKDIKNGNYLIGIYVVGYKKTFKGPFIISAEKKSHSTGSVQLLPDAKLLKGVEIVKQKPLIERQVDKTVLNIENSALAAGNNALDILQKSPGVTVDKDGKISLRGKQGVTVMLDWKPTYLSQEQLANMLRSTEGNAIQSIELITNPSAKYDAAGNSGIINIKLKKNRNFGTNGSVFGGVGMGNYYKVNSGLTLNHREKKFNIYGNFDYSRGKRYHGTDIMRVNNTATDKTYFNQTGNTISSRNSSNYKGGIDYFINDNNTLGFAFNGYNSNGNSSAKVLTLIGAQPSVTDSSVVADNPSTFKYTGMAYNLNYKGTLDTLGQEISVDADIAQYNGMEKNDFNNVYRNAAWQPSKAPYIFRNTTPTKVKIYSGKIDYTYPINKDTKLDLGAKSSFVKTDNSFLFENFINNTWANDATRSNQFLYDENINAAYANLKKKFKTTTVQLGLRAEQTNSKGNSVTDQKVVNRHYFDLFPSLFVNQELSKDHEIGFSYSRRIDRPDYSNLNPFVSYLDLYSYRYGNPFLKPQYTNAFEVSYSYKKTLNVSFGYSHTSDVMSEVLLTDTAKKTIFISTQNLATQDSYNMNVSYPVEITKWWNTNNNLTVYYNKFKTPNLAGQPYQSGKTALNLNTNQTFIISPSTNIEWSGYYQSKQVYGTLLIAAQYGVDLGLSKSFMDKKLSFKLAANDIFKLQKSQITSALPSQNYVVNERWESRVFRITCTYRFGSSSIKGARERSGGSESESRRVKSGG
ncbi:outer membrane beta-barrel protein [Pedobacter sp. HMWF019]|uniref:outer membrane beta-barrel protein n=1 Tax=Pedobacter sp. HMWF019 TaxID=2056856 RepID=UPI001304B060|nr:outer membrane beta-barrel protein [Pedobacter sp. HMWF019]